jgi:hypothetical protein
MCAAERDRDRMVSRWVSLKMLWITLYLVDIRAGDGNNSGWS